MSASHPRFAASISYLFEDLDLLDRFYHAAELGFGGVELALPYDYSAESLHEAKEAAGVDVVLFTAPLGDFMQGGEGCAAVDEKQGEFRESLTVALEYAQALDAEYVQIVAGRCLGQRGAVQRRQAYLDTLASNLVEAAALFEAIKTNVVLEAINTRDFPDYLISLPEQLRELIARCARDDIGAVFDVAHASAMGVDCVVELARNAKRYSHIQIADGPIRSVPGEGSVDFSALFDVIAGSGYEGWIGAEYRAHSSQSGCLDWIKDAQRALNARS